MPEVRVTVAVAVVLRVFLDDPTRPRYGYELMRLTGFASGKLYPLLARLERAGWLTREREDVDPSEAGRPVRRMYSLSADGARHARLALAEIGERLAPARPVRLRPEGGPA